MKKTSYQKFMEKGGYATIDFTHEEIMEHLLEIFKRDRDDLLMKAALDDTKRRSLTFILDFDNIGNKLTIFGGTVNYNKKLRKFDYITYSDTRNYAVMFSIESKVACFYYDFYAAWKHLFPFGVSRKRMTEYLLNH